MHKVYYLVEHPNGVPMLVEVDREEAKSHIKTTEVLAREKVREVMCDQEGILDLFMEEIYKQLTFTEIETVIS
jgi:hypothetical protein